MRIAIRDEHYELVQKMDLSKRHAMVDHQAAYETLKAAFGKMIQQNNIDLIDDPWVQYQIARDNANTQTKGLWEFLHENYPQTCNGRWSLQAEQGVLYRDELSDLIATLNQQAAQQFPGPAAPGTQQAAA